MFSSYRVFTLKTEPGGYTVKRTRADFKWLAEKLGAEFPNKHIASIDKGDLNKKAIEEYFYLLIEKEDLRNSRYLNYFLTAEDKMFEERKNSEESIIGSLMSKLKRSTVNTEALGVVDTKKCKVRLDN